MRLIDADELKKQSYRDSWNIAVVEVESIDNAPTVKIEYLPNYANCQSVEMIRVARPQGEWVKIKRHVDNKHVKFIYRCPFCGYVEISKANFCGNCGANMMKGIKENG